MTSKVAAIFSGVSRRFWAKCLVCSGLNKILPFLGNVYLAKLNPGMFGLVTKDNQCLWPPF